MAAHIRPDDPSRAPLEASRPNPSVTPSPTEARTVSVAVAGATGALGRRLVATLRTRGHLVRALGRDAGRLASLGLPTSDLRVIDALQATSLAAALQGAEVVISTVGASVAPRLRAGRRSYLEIDWPANRNLVEAARGVGCAHFIYIAAAGGPAHRDLAYFDAHERVAEKLAQSDLPHTVVRATGFFSAFEEFLLLARRGLVPLIGDGSARTNPIAEEDLAEACADVLVDRPAALEVGGPEILTRRAIVELAFSALGRRARFVRAPAAGLQFAAVAARPVSPRMSDLLRFVARVSTRDMIAPPTGHRRLADHFARCVQAPAR